MDIQIRYQLSLAFRLLDTTSRRVLTGSEVKLLRNGEPIPSVQRPGGYFILVNYPREDFILGIRAKGFEPVDFPVRYGELGQKLPELTIHLIPEKASFDPLSGVSIEGVLPGIRSLAAAKPDGGSCFIRGFDPKKKLLTVFNPNSLSFGRVYYALVDPENDSFEPFSIVEERSRELYLIDRALPKDFRPSFPISPIVFGRAGAEGDYCLRLRDEGGSPRWILRWETDEGAFCRAVDIRRPETFRLEPA